MLISGWYINSPDVADMDLAEHWHVSGGSFPVRALVWEGAQKQVLFHLFVFPPGHIETRLVGVKGT